MVLQTTKETLINPGERLISKNPKELLKAQRVATAIVVVVFDPSAALGAMAHMAMPDSKMVTNPGEGPDKFVDIALPLFIAELLEKGLSRQAARVIIVGGSQLFNFGGGSGNVLNIGTRNAITARTILTREGITVEKTETGGNKPRTIQLDMTTGQIQVYHPGENPRTI